MKKFLEQLAEEIISKYGYHDTSLKVILPNKRSEVFLKNYLKDKATSTYWLPEFYTTDEFIVKHSGLSQLDPILIYFELFYIHKEIEGEKAMPLEDFLSWASIMLSDFNDIDLYKADAAHVFTHLTETKAIEQWNLAGQPLTELQSNYLFFYRSLFTYYSELRSRLLDKKLGYKGMIYRHLSDNINQLSSALKDSRLVIAGFNALSIAEKEIFGYLNGHFYTIFYWDADEYYLFPGKSGHDQLEAGRFINELIKEWKLTEVKWINNYLTGTTKNIHIHGIAKQIGQVKFVGQQLRKWMCDHQIKPDDIDTAIVLADENMLLPLLYSLPGKTGEKEADIRFNVTMGYPLKNTSLSRFIMQWLNLLIRSEETGHDKFDTWKIITLLKNPIITSTLDEAGLAFKRKFISQLTDSNQIFYTKNELNNKLKSINSPSFIQVFNILFINIPDAAGFVKALIQFLQFLADKTASKSSQPNAILVAQINLMFKLIKKLQSTVLKENTEPGLKAFQKIIVQLLKRSEISLKGEPLAGVQIMGMLETRNLDFRNIILVSANEGILPKATEMESFIPFDIRHDNKLPLPKEQNDVFAYHFYRMLQRAENVTILYNTDSDKFGSGEKSRFILQLENELAKSGSSINIQNHITNISINEIPGKQTIRISKNDDVMNLIADKVKSGLSASSLNVYRNCSLKFYYSEILNLRDNRKIEPEIEFNVFGNAIHETLEEIYKPFIGKKIDATQLRNQLSKLDDLLTQTFRKVYKGGIISTGKNHLIYEVARKYIEHFLLAEINNDAIKNKIIVGLEEKVEIILTHKSGHIKLKGYLDRIEKSDGDSQVQIIDYKTGKVEARELVLSNWEKLEDTSKDKLFQLLFYAYLYEKKYAPAQAPELGIYSLRMISQGLIQPNLPEEDNQFEAYLLSLLDELFNPDVEFEQTTDDRICSYCDYKEICNK